MDRQWEVLVPKLRVLELRMLLDSLKKKRSGNRKALLIRIMSYLTSIKSRPEFEEIKSKITDLYLRTKQPLRVYREEENSLAEPFSWAYITPEVDPLPVPDNRMFETHTLLFTKDMGDLQLHTPHFKSIVSFTIPEDCRPSLLRGSELLEVQLKFYCLHESNKWEDIILYVTVNNLPLENKLPLPHVVYITRYCNMVPAATNEICFHSPKPSCLKKYTFSIAIVKRCLPERLINEEPRPFVDNTQELVSEGIETGRARSLALVLICPFSKKPMKLPCRSNRCRHVDVFDLRVFLEDMQYFLNWKCPICCVPISYETLEIDKTLKEYAEKKKLFLTFYKKRNINKDDEIEVKCEKEVIVCD